MLTSSNTLSIKSFCTAFELNEKIQKWRRCLHIFRHETSEHSRNTFSPTNINKKYQNDRSSFKILKRKLSTDAVHEFEIKDVCKYYAA